MYIIYALTHVKKNQIKEKLIVESQAYCERKQETSIHEILSNGFYIYGLAYLSCKLLKALLQGFMS